VTIPQAFERRGQRRYEQLVTEHLSPASRVASGLRAMPGTAEAFASTQAAWRFYHNPRVCLPALMEPIIETGRRALARDRGAYALVLHDWSLLHLTSHTGKKDRVVLSRRGDLGYELQAALLVSSADGLPLAPLSLSVRAADGVHCSRYRALRPPRSPLDELEPVMDFVERLKLDRPAVHIVDAEADSVGHYRSWLRRPNCLFVIRADDRVVQHEGKKVRFSQLSSQLWEQQAFRRAREVVCRGGLKGQQWVAETTVTLTHPAHPQRRDGQPRRSIPGKPVRLRLVISQIRFPDGGEEPIVWFLLTNLPADVDASQVALWYYWRWQIESYFKLLKSAGQQLEHWQQESAAAVTRRLLVASMACVLVWRLARDPSPEGAHMRGILIRLSGRQMKRGCAFTMPALLAGSWALLAMLSALEQHGLDNLQRLAAQLFAPPPRAGP
jgi:hypothetical protein